MRNSKYVPHDLAVKLKKIGYNEPCNGYYRKLLGSDEVISHNNFEKFFTNSDLDNTKYDYVTIPVYQDVFDWIFNKYKMYSYIEGSYPWFRYYINTEDDRIEGHKEMDLADARYNCLDKLLEIIG